MDNKESSLFVRLIHEMDEDEEMEWQTPAILQGQGAGGSHHRHGSVSGRVSVERDHFGTMLRFGWTTSPMR